MEELVHSSGRSVSNEESAPLAILCGTTAPELNEDEDSDWEDEIATRVFIVRREAKRSPGAQDQHDAQLTLQLTRGLKRRYACTADLQYLEQIMRLCQTFLTSQSPPEALLRAVGWALVQRYARTGSKDDMDRAIQCCGRALEMCCPGHSGRKASLNSAGAALLLRYAIQKRPEDIAIIMDYHQEALHIDTEGGYPPLTSLRHLAKAFFVRYQNAGTTEDIKESIRILRELLHIRRTPYSLSLLSRSLRFIYKESSELANLQEAVSLARESVRRCRHLSYRRPACTHALAAVLWASFVRVGEVADIDEAISLCEEGQYVTQPGPFYRTISSLLGLALQARFTRFARMDDLDRAIALQRSLLALGIHEERQYRILQSNLANNLMARFHQLEKPIDLEEAVSLKRTACDMPKSDTLRLPHLIGLGAMLLDLFKHTYSIETLDESISVLRESTEDALSKKHSLRNSSLLNLGSSLLKRYEYLKTAEDIEFALESFLRALALCAAGSATMRYECLDGVAATLRVRFEDFGRIEDAQSAMNYRHQALQLAPSGHLSRSSCLFEMAHLHLTRGAPYHSLVEACRCTVQGVLDYSNRAQRRMSGAIEVLLQAEEHSASITREERASLLEVYVEIVSLLPRAAYFGLDAQSRLRVLSKANNLATSAAVHAISLSNPPLAMELLEEGRGTFWSQALRLRTPLEDLPVSERDKLKGLFADLEQDGFSKDREGEAARKRRVSEELEAAFQSVRAIPGFDRFMLRDTFTSLAQSADRGAIINLISGSSCHALIMRGPALDLEHVELLGLTSDDLKTLRLQSNSLMTRDAGERAVHLISTSGKKGEEVLRKLWYTVVKPVLMALGYQKRDGRARPRLFWMPTGAFSFLPLHAAGEYKDKTIPVEDCCSNYVVSSYTPTLGVLRHARRPLPVNQGLPSILLAAARTTSSSRRPLKYANDELNVIKDIAPPSSVTALPSATLSSMLDALPTASVVHVVCHGKQDATSALDSGFILTDGTLTVAQLMTLNLPCAALAVLSACETAKGDEVQPDQAVHLAATMLFLGFRSVIATMWEMRDQDGPFVAKVLYEALLKDGCMDLDIVPYALDDAARQLRTCGLLPTRWATFIHQGA